MPLRTAPPASGSRAGLTYGEMLIVLAVFMVLAAMFLLSSREVIIKTRISTALSEQKMIDDALTQFEFDNSYVPNEQVGLTALQGPRKYLPTIPIDVFTKNSARYREYQYFSDLSPRHRWMLVSVGPDGKPDIEPAIQALRNSRPTLAESGSMQPRMLFATNAEFEAFLVKYAYDPTNGIDSKGDLIRVYDR